jgi:hypothetical protein
MTSTHFPAVITRLVAAPDEYASTCCPACAGELGFHQPDTRQPEHLLAVCDGCGEWFLFDLGAALIIQIPSAGCLSLTDE